MAKHLEKELERLKKLVYTLSARVEEQLELAVKSVQERDAALAEQVIANDKEIDDLEVDGEEECRKALALYQPVAIDLRFITSVLRMNGDLERIGDLAADIAKNGISINRASKPRIPLDLHQMSYLVRSIVRKSLDALVNIDTYLAREVLEDDLAIALRVPSVRVVAPIPGKNTVGVEVPNDKQVMVRMRELLQTSRASSDEMRLPLGQSTVSAATCIFS